MPAVETETIDTIDTIDQLRARRDVKLTPVVRDFRPAWLLTVSETMSRDESVFDIVDRSGERLYQRYIVNHGEVNVLHLIGELEFPESELSKLPAGALIK